ncbi:MAG: hypothetical protein Q7U94_03415 [Sideroxyarcus sp.]|nr:hypothetical protein [Sideroxyarcus sp.]
MAHLIGTILGSIVVLIIWCTIGSLVGALLLQFATNYIAKFKLSYKVAYIISFVSSLTTCVLGFFVGFILGINRIEVGIVGFGIIYIFAYLLFTWMLGVMLKHPVSGAIGFKKAALISLTISAIGICITIFSTLLIKAFVN